MDVTVISICSCLSIQTSNNFTFHLYFYFILLFFSFISVFFSTFSSFSHFCLVRSPHKYVNVVVIVYGWRVLCTIIIIIVICLRCWLSVEFASIAYNGWLFGTDRCQICWHTKGKRAKENATNASELMEFGCCKYEYWFNNTNAKPINTTESTATIESNFSYRINITSIVASITTITGSWFSTTTFTR